MRQYVKDLQSSGAKLSADGFLDPEDVRTPPGP
jgi:hypothetical protein